MAGIAPWIYRPGTSLLHRVDARFKLGFLIIISLSCTGARPLALAVSTILVLILLQSAKVSLRSMAGVLRYLAILFLLMVAARWLAPSNTAPGAVSFQFGGTAVTGDGVVGGIVIFWRLLLIVLVSLFLPLTTRPMELKAAIQWYLAPIPFIPERRIGTMASLILRFIPVIFNQGAAVADSQKARCIENRRNPVYRLTRFSLPVLRRVFHTAENLAAAMEARGYHEARTPVRLSASPGDWLGLLVVSGWSAFLVFSPV